LSDGAGVEGVGQVGAELYAVDNLPHDPLTSFDSFTTPTPEAVCFLRRELYANAQAIPTTLRGGQYGHLGLLMDDNEYSRVSPIPNILPGLPPMPVYDGATAVEQDAIKDAYKQAMDTFVEAHAFKNHLKALLIKAVQHSISTILTMRRWDMRKQRWNNYSSTWLSGMEVNVGAEMIYVVELVLLLE
jgi:hypothetical protein